MVEFLLQATNIVDIYVIVDDYSMFVQLQSVWAQSHSDQTFVGVAPNFVYKIFRGVAFLPNYCNDIGLYIRKLGDKRQYSATWTP